MQWPALKILTILFWLFLIASAPGYSQVSSYRLQQADSLFNARQFTQSLEHYRVILENKQYTSSMLLKMAFIEEGLHNTGEALYYLNLYYLATQDPSALDKMDELATKNNLSGYQSTEGKMALTFYRKHHLWISIAIAGFIFFLFSVAVAVRRNNKKPVIAVSLLFVFAVVLGVHLYAMEPATNGIVARPNTYIMQGPSGGAPVAEILQAGHRFEIKGQTDVWVKIEWKGKPAYIRENLLLPIVL